MMAQASSKHLDIYIYGVVGWDTTADNFVAELNSYPMDTTIEVFIYSIGGSFSDGLPIFNALRSRAGMVEFSIIGYCLSMASYIMLAGGKIKAAENALFMIHRAQGGAYGSADDLIKAADVLAIHEPHAVAEYGKRLKLDAEQVMALLRAETWYSAQMALDAGLVDEIIPAVDASNIDNAMPSNCLEVAKRRYKSLPIAVENQLRHKSPIEKIINAVVGEPAPVLLPPLTEQEEEMTPEQIAALASALAEGLQPIAQAMQKNSDTVAQAVAAMQATLPKPEPEPDPVQKQIADMQATIDDQAKKIAELSTPANVILPENTGDATEADAWG